MTLFCMVAPQHTYRDKQNVISKMDCETRYQNQAIYIETVNNKYLLRCIESGTWLVDLKVGKDFLNNSDKQC